jgi:hypothetical protein
MKKAHLAMTLILALGGTVFAAMIDSPEPEGDPRIKAVLEELEIMYEVDRDGDYKVLFKWEDDGRSQVAFINSGTERLDKLELREIWSAAYISEKPLKAKVANRLLEDSFEKKLGSWQVMKTGDQWVGMFTVKIDADADAASIMTALEAVLTSADEMEKELLGSDDL